MGDQLPITRRFYENKNNSYILSIFLEDVWRMNSYGEVGEILLLSINLNLEKKGCCINSFKL